MSTLLQIHMRIASICLSFNIFMLLYGVLWRNWQYLGLFLLDVPLPLEAGKMYYPGFLNHMCIAEPPASISCVHHGIMGVIRVT